MSLSKYSFDETTARAKLNQAFPLYPLACDRIAEEITRIDGMLYRDVLLKMASENVQQRKSIELFFREVNSKQIMANNLSYFSMFTEMWKTRKDRVSVEPIVQNVNALKQRIVSADDDKPKKSNDDSSSEKPRKRSSKKRRESSDDESSEKPRKKASKKRRDSSDEDSSSEKPKKKASKTRRDSEESSEANRKSSDAKAPQEPVKQDEEVEIQLTEPVGEDFSSN